MSPLQYAEAWGKKFIPSLNLLHFYMEQNYIFKLNLPNNLVLSYH